MADEKDPEIQAILSDLDAILSAEAAVPPPAPPPAAAKPAPAPHATAPPAPAPPTTAPPAPVPPAPAPQAAVPPPPAAVPVPIVVKRAPIAPPPPASPVASAPASVQAAPAPVQPAPAPAPAGVTAIPEKTPKAQIRRIAVVYTPNYSAEKDGLVKVLDSCAESLSKKPLYLRKVHTEILAPTSNMRIFAERVRTLNVVAVVGVLEGLTDAKQRELADALGEAGIMSCIVALADVQKKSLAADAVLSMMLLAPEP